MKLFIIIFVLFFSNLTFANELENSEVEVINLYESKSLDQMVLDSLNYKNEIQQVVENSNESIEIESNDVNVELIEITKDNFIRKNNTKDLLSNLSSQKQKQ